MPHNYLLMCTYRNTERNQLFLWYFQHGILSANITLAHIFESLRDTLLLPRCSLLRNSFYSQLTYKGILWALLIDF